MFPNHLLEIYSQIIRMIQSPHISDSSMEIASAVSHDMIKDTAQDLKQIKANYLCKVRLHLTTANVKISFTIATTKYEYPVQDPGFQNRGRQPVIWSIYP